MGRPWRIVLTGEGGSRDGREDDVDVVITSVSRHLAANGHTIKAVTLQTEGKQVDLLKDPAEPKPRNATATRPPTESEPPAKPNPDDKDPSKPGPEKPPEKPLAPGPQKPATR